MLLSVEPTSMSEPRRVHLPTLESLVTQSTSPGHAAWIISALPPDGRACSVPGSAG